MSLSNVSEWFMWILPKSWTSVKKTPKKNPQNPPQTEVFGTKEKISITGKFQLVNFNNYTNYD